MFLQETQLIFYKPKYVHKHYPTFFLANAPDKTRGVAICVAKSLAFSPSQVVSDPGNFLLVKGRLGGQPSDTS